MKKTLQILIMLAFIGLSANATSIIINQNWLYPGPNCPIPVTKEIYVEATCTGYLATDSFSCKIYFGDGTDTTLIRTDDTLNYLSFGFSHIYTTMGMYSVKSVVTSLVDGMTDSLISNNFIYVGDSCSNISGRMYLDNNSNCVYDAGTDSVMRMYPVKILLGANIIGWSSTDTNGIYHFTEPTGFTYTVEPIDMSSSFQLNCPLSGYYSFLLTSSSTGNDFGLNCLNGFDVSGNMEAGNICPGRNNSYVEGYAYNFRCQPTSGTVKIILDPLETYLSAYYNPPTSISGDTLIWDYSNMSSNYFYPDMNITNWWTNFYANQEFKTIVRLYTSTLAILGDSACFTMIVDPIIGDSVPSNNIIHYCREINTSWDPNNKEVYPKGIGANNSIAPTQRLTYTIHFQNTGTDTAFNIGVYDTLDANLDMNTFQMLNADHDFRVELLPNNVVKFIFDNIMLPDSSTSQLLSQGQFSYSIKPISNVANGVVIYNRAGIVFDYNLPVMTNTTHNMIDLTLGVKEIANNNTFISVFPNPVSNNLAINYNLSSSSKVEINVFDMLGSKIAEIANDRESSGQHSISWNASDVPQGIYLLQVIVDNKIINQKITVIK